MKRLLWSFASLAVLVCGTGRADAAVLWDQPWDGTSNAFSSQNATNGLGNFATVYDNFTIGYNATVSVVDWTGQIFNGSPASITGFTLTFYGDNSGIPGSVLATEFVSGDPQVAVVGFQTYSYELTLATAFSAAANTQYWLSIVPTMDFPPQWGWSTSLSGDGDGQGYQVFFGSGNVVVPDLAFSLQGDRVTPPPGGVPEPASVVVWTLVAGFFAAGRFRKRQK
jgi:hypothetical protein